MRGTVRVKIGVGSLVGSGAVLFVVAWVASCGTAPTPFIVSGPGGVGNDLPTLTILEPDANITRGQGDPFLIQWTDTDRDDNAQIAFLLVSTTSNETVLLTQGIDEDDLVGPDRFLTPTTLIPSDSYNLLGIIDDSTNPPVEEYALVVGTAVQQRVIVRIVGPGEGPQTVPPIVTVTEPTFSLSMAQDDVLTVSVQPTAAPDPNNPVPFDPDSNLILYVLLDLDLDPNNDDPANPDASQIIILRQQTVQTGNFEPIQFEIPIDISVIPPRSDGLPYYIRATADDGTNPRVHQYAAGTINVVQLAAGTVDLYDIGRTRSGAKFQGFNPGANLGSSLAGGADFDADGIEDFALVAQFGNPQNVGPVGEAYLIYGQDNVRFGGTIPINAVSEIISGVVFQAPPVRTAIIPDANARTNGITHVTFLDDLTNDGRPEIGFGLPHVHGAYDSTDYDPADEEVTEGSPFGCYPDPYVNNHTDQDTLRQGDTGFYAGGMAVIVNSQNRDNDGPINVNRLESTAVSLELTGQFPTPLDGDALSDSGFILSRADNTTAAVMGNDPQEPNRISGSRYIAGGYDFIFQNQVTPREGLFGQQIATIGDLGADGQAEIIISAPRNERYLYDLENEPFLSTHLASTSFVASIIVLPGRNYNTQNWREMDTDTGTSVTPYLDHHTFTPFGSCSGNPPSARGFVIPAEMFGIFAEDIDDMLGNAQSAGDFNQDGIGDILCSAPLNDLSDSTPDTGSVYVIYGRSVFGDIDLSTADDALLRPPMLRIFGLETGDQLGWRVSAGLDVNGDRIDDVFISSPYTDFGDVRRSTCAADYNQDGVVSQIDLGLRSFETCEDEYGQDLFSDDGCKAFDYDNDGDIDDDDRCVFCCLSDDCEPNDTCTFGTEEGDCCNHLVDNGVIGIVFGGTFIDGDRSISQLATTQLPGVIFYGSSTGHRAGFDIESAGDFNQDGYGDIIISVPGEIREDSAGRQRLGVVYLIFGGTHLINTIWDLEEVGSEDLPGIIFLSPYVRGRPNEAAPTEVAYIGDINNDGFGDIAIGNPKADFIDPTYPQGPDAPGSDPATGRRSDVGDAYVIYGNNFGSNRAAP